MRAEDGFLLGHLDAMGEAEKLEAAAVGEDGPVPAHEAVQAAQGGDHLFARPQGEMVGIAQDHFRPAWRERCSISSPLTLPCVATGMKAGSLHLAVRRGKDAPPRGTVGIDVQQAEERMAS